MPNKATRPNHSNGHVIRERSTGLLNNYENHRDAKNDRNYSSMCEGKAIGGPRDGVKLSASLQWDGRIRKQTKEGETTNSTYPGFYKWTTLDTDEFDIKYTWVWQPDKEHSLSPERGRPRKGYHQSW